MPIMDTPFKGDVKICKRLCCVSNLSKMHYEDYYWDSGVPKGKHVPNSPSDITYKIHVDPYRKRYSVEEYQETAFQKILYDSALFDFRSLFKGEDASWQREILSENPLSSLTLIRNMEERIILKEELLYDLSGHCRGCTLFSCHGIPLGTQILFDRDCGDPFTGVQFKDITGRVVLQKEYEKNKKTGEFESLVKEIKTFRNP